MQLALGAERLESAQVEAGPGLDEERRRLVNRMLIDCERLLTSPDGLPKRPWFKHLLYAPGAYTGYGVKTIPGVREAIEQGRFAEADAEIVRVAQALDALTAQLESATMEISR